MSVFDDLGLPDPSAKTQEKQDIFAELGLPKPESTKQNKGIAGDFGTDLKRGFLGIPAAVTGLIDIPVAAVTGRPLVSEGWQGIGELTGFQPGKWAKEAEAEYSPARQKAQREIDAAWENGTAGDISGAYARIGNTLGTGSKGRFEKSRLLDKSLKGT